jgi:hypothetical protein
MMEKKQTAVEWLEGEFDNFLKWHEGHHSAEEYTLQKFSEQFQKAIAMEREQMEHAYDAGYTDADECQYTEHIDFDDYHETTYGK